MKSVSVYRSVSPAITSCYEGLVALPPSLHPRSQQEHRYARCSPSYQLSPLHPSPSESYSQRATPSLQDVPHGINRTQSPVPNTLASGSAGSSRYFLHPTASSHVPKAHPLPHSISPSRVQPSRGSSPSLRRVTIPQNVGQPVPSPIGTPVSPTNQAFRFKPIVENDDEVGHNHGRRDGGGANYVIDLSPSTPEPSPTPHMRRAARPRPHARLSILLTPPLSATSSQGAPSPPPTPIVTVLEEGYHDCLRAVLKQDALVAAVNHTRHLRINSTRLYCPESQARSQGAYGDVWIGRLDETLCDARTVAVKRIRLKPQDGPSSAGLLKALLQEVIPWYGLDHRNITPFIGYTFDSGHAALISEWQDNGHVFEYLAKHPRASRLDLIAQTAEGLAYLHDKSPSLVHGDIKPENVLVSKEGVIKLTDFGLSTILHSQSTTYLRTTYSFRGTVHYADPALLNGQPTTRFTDIWAFAWLAFGILTLRRPYDGVQPESRVILKIMSYDVPHQSKYPSIPYGKTIWPVLQASWSPNPKERWSAGHISRYIRRAL